MYIVCSFMFRDILFCSHYHQRIIYFPLHVFPAFPEISLFIKFMENYVLELKLGYIMYKDGKVQKKELCRQNYIVRYNSYLILSTCRRGVKFMVNGKF